MTRGTNVSKFPLFSWMLLEVNSWYGIQEYQINRRWNLWGEVGREGLIYKAGCLQDLTSHLDIC